MRNIYIFSPLSYSISVPHSLGERFSLNKRTWMVSHFTNLFSQLVYFCYVVTTIKHNSVHHINTEFSDKRNLIVCFKAILKDVT